ncbi:MAG TPA: serine kinase [Pseudolabrys sp.]|jgi:HPr kinase/phosphorylase|nr:serine kinase [Pseudolabrys sp.]
MAADSTIHASAVLAGPKAILIRGPSGSGKSLLAWNLINAASQGMLPFARLVGDDRLEVIDRSGKLLVRPAQALSGLIEIHGLGIRRLPFESVAVVGWVVDLAAADAARLPAARATTTSIGGVSVARLAVAAGMTALPMVLAALRTSPAGN